MASSERFAVFGIGRPRAAWFGRLGQWSVSGAVPIDFVRCLTPDEFEARLSAGQPCSALIADSPSALMDRDMLARARSVGAAVIVVGEQPASAELMVAPDGLPALRLALDFGPDDLMEVLRSAASPLNTEPQWEPELVADSTTPTAGVLIGVCGSGGSGTSSVAAGLAQVLSSRGPTLLVDACLRGDQAVLHDVDGTVPGLSALVDAHRRVQVTWPLLASHLYLIEERGYHLLTGLRRPSAWTSLRPQALSATLVTLLAHFRWVVCDTDADWEGEAETGSADVEDRNVMARTVLPRADAVALVATPQLRSVHWLLRALRELRGLGVDDHRARLVVNRAGRRSAKEVASCVARLGASATLPMMLTLPERSVEQAWRDGTRLPEQFAAPLRAFADVAPTGQVAEQPVRLVPGELGLPPATGDAAVSWG